MEGGRKAAGDFAIGASSALFAVGAVVVKVAGDGGYSGWFISASRFGVGAALCVAFMLATRSSFKVHGPKDVVLRGVFGALAMVLYFVSISMTGAGRATLFNTLYPIFVVVFGALFFKERPTRWQVAALLVALPGVFLALWDGSSGSLGGDLIGLASSVAAGFSVHYSKRARERNNSWNVYLWVCVAGLLSTGWSAGEAGRADWAGAAVLVGSGAIFFAAQIAFTWGLKFTSAANASILSFLKVPAAMALGVAFMGEAMSLKFALGSLLVAGSVVALELEGRFGRGKLSA